MSKIFRLHSGGADTIEDWATINGPLTDTFIKTIVDPGGENAKKQITSIPSPFARMDLVRTAFRTINAENKTDGGSIYHRIVSDALDIAQIFFNADSLKNKIEIISWNPGISLANGKITIDDSSDLGQLINSNNPKLKLLGETLKLFLVQDSDAYNFQYLKNIYLINYIGGNVPDKINIIGGTSPASLFFSSANEGMSGYVDIQFGADRVFDTEFNPLYKRSDDFVKYFFALQMAMPEFSSRFKDINDYLDLTFKSLKPELKALISKFDRTTYDKEYKNIVIDGKEGFNPEVLDYKIREKKGEIPRDCDFAISASKPIDGLTPYVLPNETNNENLNYVNGPWRPDYRAPFYDLRPLQDRTLPNQDIVKYPYLTVSDFLEPYIIRLPYPINKEKYFNGYLDSDTYGYALPLKKEFFKYFSIRDLEGTVADGKKRFQLDKKAGDAVEAIIRIPIQKNKYIQFNRLYTPNQFQDKIQQPSQENNKGVIVDNQFGMTIYPFLKTGNDETANYRVMLIDRDVSPLTKYNEYQLAFYKESNVSAPLTIVDKKQRSNKKSNLVTTLYHVVNKEFDIVEIKPNSDATGLIIPIFIGAHSGSSQFSFAVDFGTTNTHIEFSADKGPSKPFEITESDIQCGSLHYNTLQTGILLRDARLGLGAHIITELIPKEFLPERIGKSSQYKFPIRTVITENKLLNLSLPTYTLADFNIPFVYEKTDLPNNFRLTPNLKWANFKAQPDNMRRVESFIETLLMLIRNKVLLNGGDLDLTKIVWFYPSSMSEHRRNMLEGAWNTFTKKYIAAGTEPNKLSESIAPFYYFKSKGGIQAYDKPVASIDIGGGTTDIVIYKDNKPVILTSFKFAANSIFGDGYGYSSASNGFVQKYYELIKGKLQTSELDELVKAMDQIKENDSSQEIITFFFSLEANKNIKDGNFPISFSRFLKEDEDFKVTFLFFYSAIIYHLANLMRARNLECPRYITFSGTGSKLINIADPGVGLKNLTELTKIIFQDVYSETGVKKVEVQTSALQESGTGSKVNDTSDGGPDLSNLSELNKKIFKDVRGEAESKDGDGETGNGQVKVPKPNIELRQYDEPKEITCKGGLMCDDFVDVDDIKTVLVGSRKAQIVPDTILKYNDLDKNNLQPSVVEEVTHFIKKFFDWNDQYNYFNKFGVSPSVLENNRESLKDDLMQYLMSGVKEKQSEVQDNINVPIEETLFFYPLVGALNKLAQNIYSTIKR